MATVEAAPRTPTKTLNVASKDFAENKFAYYRWLREEAPVYKGKMLVMNVYFLSRYNDVTAMLKDPRFLRNRTTATGGGSRFPMPLPKNVQYLTKSMINDDDPNHKRLRDLVQQAFTPSAISNIEPRIEALTHQLLDELPSGEPVDLSSTYALEIPVTVIRELLGVEEDDMPKFHALTSTLIQGFTGIGIVRTLFWDIRRAGEFVRDLIARKRANPGDDVLTGLINAEAEGDRLSEDELVTLVYLLIFAGYETTVHLISNSVLALLQHPGQLERLRTEPDIASRAVEELTRFAGPIHGTKPAYAAEDIELHGTTIPRGAMVMPLLGAANRDPAIFTDPETLDLARTPNRHVGFGFGPHTCLGAVLARMETKLALTALLDRYPKIQLAIPPDQLELQRLPLWHRYKQMPVILG